MANYPVFQIRKGDWRSVPLVNIKGMYMPKAIIDDPAVFAHYISNFQTKSDDVFVASYPKSGERLSVSWLRVIYQKRVREQREISLETIRERGGRSSAFIVSRFLEPLMKYKARVFDLVPIRYCFRALISHEIHLHNINFRYAKVMQGVKIEESFAANKRKSFSAFHKLGKTNRSCEKRVFPSQLLTNNL